jgi:hypothetical protein
VDRLGHLHVGHRRQGGGGAGDQVRGRAAAGRVRLMAGLGDVHLVPGPALAPFLGVPRVQVIRRDQAGSARREALLVPPPDHLLPVRVKLLDPDQPQRLHRGQPGQPARRSRGVHLAQQVIAVAAVLHGQLRTGRLAGGQPQVSDLLPVDLLPGRVDHAGQPARRRGGQRLQRRPDRLPGQLQPVHLADPAQHVRGIGPLRHPRPGQAQPGQPGQQHLQQHRLHPPRHQPRTELAQHREVEPLIIEPQAQAVLPVQPPPHRISGLPARQVLGEPGRPPHPVRPREHLIRAPRAQLIPDPDGQRPLPERPLRHPGRLGRHLRPRTRLHRHDDPILRPGTGTGKDAGRNPHYARHHDRRPRPAGTQKNKPTGSYQGCFGPRCRIFGR